MLKLLTSSKFRKDLKKMKGSGKDFKKLENVLNKLIKNEKLSKQYRNHKLIGEYKNKSECHIEGDWLLIYEIKDKELILLRTGSHSDLFD